VCKSESQMVSKLGYTADGLNYRKLGWLFTPNLKSFINLSNFKLDVFMIDEQ